jgi:hypothetical protein
MTRFTAVAFALVVFLAATSARAQEVWQTLPKFPPMPAATESRCITPSTAPASR